MSQIARRETTQIARREKTQIEIWLESPATLSQLKAALPSHFAADRMARLALTQFRTVKNLAECNPASIMACVMTAAQLGLEPGVLGSCYLIPRMSKKNGLECTLIVGYQGLLDLIRRSGQVKSIAARVVYESDVFEVDYSSSVPFVHKPDLRRKDSRILGFYCHAILESGEHLFEWMPLHEVNAIRARSRSKDDGPWVTDFAEMGKKTVLRRAAKYLPRSIEFSDALVTADRSEFGSEVTEAAPAPVPTVEHVEHVEVRPPAPPSSPSSAARLPAPPPAPRSQLVEAIDEAPAFAPSPEVVPFEDDGFPL